MVGPEENGSVRIACRTLLRTTIVVLIANLSS